MTNNDDGPAAPDHGTRARSDPDDPDLSSPRASSRRLFYTVAEAADVLRVDKATIYRAIREDAFPAVRVRSRYVIPVAALERLAAVAVESGGRVEVAAKTAERRAARVLDHLLRGDR